MPFLQVMTHLNEEKRRTEGQIHIFDIYSEIENCPASVVSSHRRFVLLKFGLVLRNNLPLQLCQPNRLRGNGLREPALWEGLRADAVPVHRHSGCRQEEVEQDAQHIKVAKHCKPGGSWHPGTWTRASANQGKISQLLPWCHVNPMKSNPHLIVIADLLIWF